ncbi:MAG TPA: ABC transporter substrate-binding protein [Thermomicrobiales bacterium]|jgi:iron complex transport system substrate-binding protein|nr:ABC transporter substrate-binding protein [Thermomicrobiales bacterium]
MTNRRQVIGMGAALAATAAIGGRAALAQDATPAASPDGTPAGTTATGEWSFTDDKGVTVTLPQRPTRLAIDVNAAAPLWDFGIRPVALFGWNILADGTLTDAGGNIELSDEITLAGDVVEPVRVEDLVATEPELLITITFDTEDPLDYWSFTPEILEQVQAGGYPIIALNGSGNVGETVVRFAELAESLGADLSTPEQVEAKDLYEAKTEEMRASIAAKPDLTYLFGYLSASELYFASVTDFGDLTFFSSLGLQIPTVGAEPGTYWTQISPEQLGSYPGDVIFNSTRPGNFSVDELQADPVFNLHPAIGAGQVFGWNQDVIMSYQGLTIAMDAVLQANEASNKVT